MQIMSRAAGADNRSGPGLVYAPTVLFGAQRFAHNVEDLRTMAKVFAAEATGRQTDVGANSACSRANPFFVLVGAGLY
jgi:hypothetical protein